MSEENDYGEEKEMFLKLIFTADKKDKPKHFDQGGLFPPPFIHVHCPPFPCVTNISAPGVQSAGKVNYLCQMKKLTGRKTK